MPEPSPLKTWEIVLASIVGGIFLTIADIIFSENKAVTTKMSKVVGRYAGPELDAVWFESLAFVVLIGLGLGLCFVFRPNTRPAAFVRGSSVIGVLVGMNIGAQAIIPAAAQDFAVEGTVLYSLEEPRSFGPFGVGTLLTGRSSVTGTPLDVQEGVSLSCEQLKMIGREEYCAVDPEAARSIGVPQDLGDTRQIWIQRDIGKK